MKKRISVFSIVCLLLAAVSLVVVLYRMWLGEEFWHGWPSWLENPYWLDFGASMIAWPLFEASVAGGAVSIILDALGLRWQPPRWQKWLWIVPLILTAIYLMIFMGIWLSSRVWPPAAGAGRCGNPAHPAVCGAPAALFDGQPGDGLAGGGFDELLSAAPEPGRSPETAGRSTVRQRGTEPGRGAAVAAAIYPAVLWAVPAGGSAHYAVD